MLAKDVYIWLSTIRTFRKGDTDKLTTLFKTPGELSESLRDKDVIDRLVEKDIIKEETGAELLDSNIDMSIEKIYEDMQKSHISCVTIIDEDYPSRLLSIPDKPLCIYYRGDISLSEKEYIIASVGSRRPTHYGISMATEFASVLGSKGIVIISGMAYGIDAKSHQSCIEAGGKTIAVLGGGVDICYPRTNMNIYHEMCEEHLVLSEYPPGTEHISLHFPLRNRLISGMSDGLLVIEAALRSGTLITTDYALEQGRNIYAIPGRADDMMSKGVNNLIKQGAALVDTPADIITDLTGVTLKRRKRRPKPEEILDKNKAALHISNEEKNILGILGYEPIYIDDIIRANRMNISETIHSLRHLEQLGLIEAIEQSYYILKYNQ